MKNVLKCIILLFVFNFQLIASEIDVQNTIIKLNTNYISIGQLINEIEKQTRYYVIYSNQEVDSETKVYIQNKSENLTSCLQQAFEKSNISFEIDNNYIILTKKNVLTKDVNKIQQGNKQIKGVVIDVNGESLIGVNVYEKGSTTNGTSTDINGNFTINVPDGSTLVISYVGFITQEIVVDEIARDTSLTVTLIEDSKSLEEVVVIGYGTMSKKNVSGSVTNVLRDDFNQGVSLSASDLLQGKVAGLVITTKGGDITVSPTIRLRGVSSLTGSSSPFVVIDGIPGMDLWSISPEDIETISVLKDASSSAIYGSRSASGVILITTKKGKYGQSVVEYNGYFAGDFMSKRPDLLSAEEWRSYTAEKGLSVTGIDKGANTDWIKEITRNGFAHNHNLALSGGLRNGSYRISMNYLDRIGIMDDNNYERYNGLVTFNQKALDDRLKITFMASLSQSDYSPVDGYNIELAYNMPPVYPIKNDDGTWFVITDFAMGNPVHNIAINRDHNKDNSLMLNTKLELEVFKGFTAGVSLLKRRDSYDGAYYAGKETPSGRTTNGYARRNSSVSDNGLIETTLNYSLNVNKHSIDLLGGYSWENNDHRSMSASNRNFLSDIFEYNNLALGEDIQTTDVGSYKSNTKLISFFGRIGYIYNEKYIFSATLRRDGSSKFGVNNKWANFPSISAAWRISDESFMDEISMIDELKIRVGYGVVGNQSGIGAYNSIALYGRGDQYYNNGVWRNSYRYTQNHNPDLKWEQTSSFNPGIDFALFNNRLSGSIDYYIKNTKDLLYRYAVPVPPYLYNRMLANVGDMSNKGIEIVLNGGIIEQKDFNWNVSVNFAHNKNKVVRLSNDIYQTDRILLGGLPVARGVGNVTTHILEEGQAVGTYYNYKHLGISEDGNFIIWDKDENGIINPNDYTYLGCAQPKFTYGIQNTFRYKRFDLSFFFRGVNGNKVINTPKLQYGTDRWLPGMNIFREAMNNPINRAYRFSDYYLEDGSFLRLDNAVVGYSFNLNKTLGINKFRLYVSGQNLLLITKFGGLDPEISMDGLSPGALNTAYIPRPRTLTFGVNLSF